MTRLTRAGIQALAAEIRAAVAAGRTSIGHGQFSIDDGRKALVVGLWRLRQQERQRAPKMPAARRQRRRQQVKAETLS